MQMFYNENKINSIEKKVNSLESAFHKIGKIITEQVDKEYGFPSNDLLTIPEFSKKTNLSIYKIRKEIEKGRIIPTKVSEGEMISSNQLTNYIN